LNFNQNQQPKEASVSQASKEIENNHLVNQVCQDDEDESNNLRVYADGETDRDETQSVTCSIPSIIKNDLESSTAQVASQHNEFSELLNRMNSSRYDPINESSNSLNWTLVQPHQQPIIQQFQHHVSVNNSPFNFNINAQNAQHQPNQQHHPNKRMRYDEETSFNKMEEAEKSIDQSMNNEVLEYSGKQDPDDSDDQHILEEFIDECYNQPNGSFNDDDQYEESLEQDEECNQSQEEADWQRNTNQNRLTLPKIDEAAEEEEMSNPPNEMNKKKTTIHKPGPFIQMTKTALLRANRLKEMKSASTTSQAASFGKRAKPNNSSNTQVTVNRQVKENAGAGEPAKKHVSQNTGGLKKASNSGSSRLSNISVLTAMNMHASKFNKN
jgi:hypothetical protein